MNDRFSRENILKTIWLIKYDHTAHVITELLSKIIDFFPIIALVVWIAISNILDITETFQIFYIPIYNLVLIFLVLLIIYWMYLIFLKFNSFKVINYNIRIKDLSTPVKLIFVSDFHLGNEWVGTRSGKLGRIIKKINEINSDIVILGGDYIVESLSVNLSQLHELKANNIFAVCGNHDSWYLQKTQNTEAPIKFIKKFEAETGLNLQINTGHEFVINGQKIFMGGISDLYSVDFNFDRAFKDYKDGIKMLVSHNPDIIDFIEEKDNISLVLSGHTHAGQILIPFINIHLPMPTKYQWLTKGVFQINKITKLFLSQGIGYSGTRIRIGTECEIAVLKLEPA